MRMHWKLDLGFHTRPGDQFADPVGKSEVITIDLMRRAGKFQNALELAEETKTMNIEEIINQVIRFEEALINLKDIGIHTVSETLGNQEHTAFN